MDIEKKQNNMEFFSLINAVFILVCVVGCVYTLFCGNGLFYTVTAVVGLASLVFSALYFFFGYKKNASKYYRLFMLFYAFTYLAEAAAGIIGFKELGININASFALVVGMILYGNALILAVGKDLGKKVALTLCAVNVIAYLVPIIAALVPGLIEFETESVKASGIILFFSWLVLAVNALVMTLAKYTDKAIRATK